MSTPNGVKRRKVDFSDVIARGFQTEQNVGLTEFIGKQKPFIAILKHRFEDFVVHEINKSGSTVRLECYDEPEDIALEEEEQEPKIDVTELKVESKLLEDIRAYSENHSTLQPVLIPVAELAKEDRAKIHLYIRQNFTQLDSKTETVDQKMYIKIVHDDGRNPRRKGNEKRKGDNRSQKRLRWPKSKPNYVHFVLYKENMETIQVVNELARRLACTPKNFTFAGTKDKRAITTQMFSVWKTNPRQIWKAVQEFNRRSRFNIRIHVGQFDYSSEPLKLGDLSGNHFEIILRNVRLVEDDDESVHTKTAVEVMKANVEESLKTVQNVGFINYFGMQRFGSHRVDSHKLGILILKRDFKQLVNEILVEKPLDLRPYNNRNEISFNEAIRIWRDTGDAGLAYKKMNYKYTIEGSLLRALTRVDQNDFHGALCIGLLRNSRLLYLHAYQSYLWNRIASFRIREYGLEVAEGDLVFVGPELVPDEDDVREMTEEGDAPPDNDQNVETDSKQDNDKTNEQPKVRANIPSEQIVLATAENRSQFTIYDVVLPIIGGLSKLPQNRVADHIDALLKEDGIKLEDFSSLSKQWCVNGSYRKLVVKPANFEWKWLQYSDDTKPLIDTDVDRIEGKETVKNEVTAEDETKLRNALQLGVTLPTSSYATVLLREVTKLSSLSLENKPWQQQQQPTTGSSANGSNNGVSDQAKQQQQEESLMEQSVHN